jgi:hypothetical protein
MDTVGMAAVTAAEMRQATVGPASRINIDPVSAV